MAAAVGMRVAGGRLEVERPWLAGQEAGSLAQGSLRARNSDAARQSGQAPPRPNPGPAMSRPVPPYLCRARPLVDEVPHQHQHVLAGGVAALIQQI